MYNISNRGTSTNYDTEIQHLQQSNTPAREYGLGMPPLRVMPVLSFGCTGEMNEYDIEER